MILVTWLGLGGGGIISTAVLALGTLGFGVANPPRLPPAILCLGRPGVLVVGTPIDTLDGFGVTDVDDPRPLTEALSVPCRAESSCLAVIPTYFDALDPAVILLVGVAALALVLAPSSVRTGRPSDSSV
jgi:hypothetical protein